MIPVLVCGGGPVGLTLALELAAWEVPVVLVERHAAPLPFPKGRALSIRTMEVFRQLGLEEEITAAGLPRAETMHFFYGESLTAEHFTRVSNTPPPGGSPHSPTFNLACSQDVLEAILRDRAAAHPLVDARFGTTVTDVQVHADHAVVTARTDGDPDADRMVCRWLVAADGAHSTLRERTGIGRTTYEPTCENVNILFEADLSELISDRSSLVYTISNDRVHGGLLTVDGRRWLANVVEPEVDPPGAAADLRWCGSRIHDLLGAPVPVQITAAMPWTATAANAHRYREGPLLLVGDAAHVATPYGGFGMNCGIAAAHNLGWKLALHLLHGAPEALVDTYEEERRPIAERTVAESAVRLQSALDAHRDGRTRRGEVSGNPSDGLVLGGAYRSSAVLGPHEHHPDDDRVGTYVPSTRPGVRAPHAWLGDGRSTLDLFGPHLTVLHHPATSPEVPSSLGSMPVAVVALDDLLDPGGAARRAYDIASGGSVAVRPDGHITWRSP